jgi:hypothetical protein
MLGEFMRIRPINLSIIFSVIIFLVNGARVSFAQTTSFTYQGKFTDGAVVANGTYQIKFELFDAASDGNQVGSTVTNANVQAIGGVFTVDLDFGSGAFNGAQRYLQLSIFSPTTNSFVTLSPRQQVTSTPYAIRALSSTTTDNALSLGGVPAASYVITGDDRLSDARTPLPGSNDYVQNTTTAQASANFNIGGTGKANVFDAATQFNIGGLRVMSSPGPINIFVGPGVGQSSGGSNAFFGGSAGLLSSSGSNNTYIGGEAGEQSNNSSANTFIGSLAGYFNTSGSGNTVLGSQAGPTVGNLSFATAIGFGATVSASNTIVLGRSQGQESVLIPGNLTTNGSLSVGGTFSTNIVNATTQFNLNNVRILAAPGTGNFFAGIGAGQANATGASNTFVGSAAGQANISGQVNTYFGSNAGKAATGSANSFFGASAGLLTTTGTANAFFGNDTGKANTIGTGNSFFGSSAAPVLANGNQNSIFGSIAGLVLASGSNNSLFGASVAQNLTSGSDNIIIGYQAAVGLGTGSGNTIVGTNSGLALESGGNNTLIGKGADVGVSNLSNATAIGVNAIVSQSNAVVLGSTNAQVGIGTATPKTKLEVNSGDIYLNGANQGIILKAPNSACYRVTVSNTGTLTSTLMSCP